MAFDPDSYLAEKEAPAPAAKFDPDQYLQAKEQPAPVNANLHSAPDFDADAYLKKTQDTKVQSMVDNPDFDPVAHYGSNPSKESLDEARAVFKARANTPGKGIVNNTLSVLKGAIPAVHHGLQSFARGVAGAVGNLGTILGADTDTTDPELARAQRENAATVQLGAMHGIDTAAGLKRNIQRLFGKTDRTLTDQEIDDRIQYEAAHRSVAEDLAKGNVVANTGEGTAPLINQPLGFAERANLPNPEKLAQAGAPINQQKVEDMSFLSDPALVALGPIGEAAGPLIGKAITAPVLNAASAVVGGAGKLGQAVLGHGRGGLGGLAIGALTHSPLTAIGGYSAELAAKHLAPPVARMLGEAAEEAAGRALPQVGQGLASKAFKGAATGAVSGTAMSLPFVAAAQSPEEAGAMLGGGFGLGAALGPIHAAASEGKIEKAAMFGRMAQEGAQVNYGMGLDAPHAQAMAKLPQATQDVINSYRARFNGQTDANGVPIQIYALTGPDYAKAAQDNGGGSASDTRGFVSGDGNKIFINADAATRTGAARATGRAAETLGHEAGGHVTEFLAEIGQKHDIAQLQDTLRQSVYQDGAPTKEFQRFIDSYKGDLLKNGATQQQIDRIEQRDPRYFEKEILAQHAAKILTGQNISDFNLPKPISEKLVRGAGDWLRNQGILPTRGGDIGWTAKEIRNVTSGLRDVLYKQGAQSEANRAARIKGETPEPTVAARIAQLEAQTAVPPTASSTTKEAAAYRNAQRELQTLRPEAPQAPALSPEHQSASEMLQALGLSEQDALARIKKAGPRSTIYEILNPVAEKPAAEARVKQPQDQTKKQAAQTRRDARADLVKNGVGPGEAYDLMRAAEAAHGEPITDPAKLALAALRVKNKGTITPGEFAPGYVKPAPVAAPITPGGTFNDHEGRPHTITGPSSTPVQPGDIVVGPDGKPKRVHTVNADGSVDAAAAFTPLNARAYPIKAGEFTKVDHEPAATPANPPTSQAVLPVPNAPEASPVLPAPPPEPARGIAAPVVPEPAQPGLAPVQGGEHELAGYTAREPAAPAAQVQPGEHQLEGYTAVQPAPEPVAAAIATGPRAEQIGTAWRIVDEAGNPGKKTYATRAAAEQGIRQKGKGSFELPPNRDPDGNDLGADVLDAILRQGGINLDSLGVEERDAFIRNPHLRRLLRSDNPDNTPDEIARLIAPNERNPEDGGFGKGDVGDLPQMILDAYLARRELDRQTKAHVRDQKAKNRQFQQGLQAEIKRARQVAADAALLAGAGEKNTNTKAAKQRIKDAQVSAIMDALDAAGDTSLKRSTDALGTKIEGEFDPNNPLHVILAELNPTTLTPQGAEALVQMQDHRGEVVNLLHRGASKQTETDAPTTSEREVDYAAETAGQRAAGEKEGHIQKKSVLPLGTELTDKGLMARFFTFDNLLHNARQLFDFMASKGLPNPYGNDQATQEKQLLADVNTYARNHENGFRGDGSGPIAQFPDSGLPRPVEGYEPGDVIPKDRFDALNLLFHSEKANQLVGRMNEIQERQAALALKPGEEGAITAPKERQRLQGVLDRTIARMRQSNELYNLAQENNRWVDHATGEVNELRAKLKAQGFDMGEHFKSPFENMLPENILEVTREAPTGAYEPDVRQHGFKMNPADLGRSGMPNEKAVGANFMPDTATPKEKAKARAEERKERQDFAKSLPSTEHDREPNRVDSPYSGEFKEGQLTADHYGDDPYIYENRFVDPVTFKDNLKLEGMSYEAVANMPTVQQYVEWYKQGHTPPPIDVVINHNDGKHFSTNRRRVVAALEAGITKIPARMEVGRASDFLKGGKFEQRAEIAREAVALEGAAKPEASTKAKDRQQERAGIKEGLDEIGDGARFMPAEPASTIHKDAEELSLKYNGAIELDGKIRGHLFTDNDPNSPSYKATFMIKGEEASREAIEARLNIKKKEFQGDARFMPDAEREMFTPPAPTVKTDGKNWYHVAVNGNWGTEKFPTKEAAQAALPPPPEPQPTYAQTKRDARKRIDDRMKAEKSEPDAKNLLAVHTLTAKSLQHALKLGALPSPSIAIIRNDRSNFNGYGEITLVAGPDLIDPVKNKDAKTFNADIYSPTYPRVNTDANGAETIFDYTPKGKVELPHTLENVVKMMNRRGTRAATGGGREGFGYGMGDMRALVAKEFKTMEKIKGDRDKIIDRESMGDLKQEVEDEYSALEEKYSQGGPGHFDTDLEALATKNWKYLKTRYPHGVPNAMHVFLQKLKGLPAEYFESKIRRAVKFDEFQGAVIPDTTAPEIRQALEKSGLKIEVYKSWDANDRKAAVERLAKSKDANFMPDHGKPEPARKPYRDQARTRLANRKRDREEELAAK